MKKQSVIIYAVVTGLILAAAFTLFGCSGDENAPVLINPVPDGPKFNYPSGITAISIPGTETHLYIADTKNHTIRKVVVVDNLPPAPPTITVSTIAGKAGVPGTTTTAVPGADARFKYPRGITTDGTNLYVADSNNHAIYKIVINATWDVTKLAGVPGTSGSDDTVAGIEAKFNKPYGIIYDSVNQKLYVADTNNHAIRSVELISGPTYGEVRTVAGAGPGQAGADDLIGTSAKFNLPIGLATDGTSIYVGDTGNNKIRRITISDGSVTSVTGSANTAEAADYNDGPVATAKFYKPAGLALIGNDLYVADQYNQVVRHIDLFAGTVAKVAGTPNFFYKSNDQVRERLKFPQAITTLDGTTLYAADTFGHAIRRLFAPVSPIPLEVLTGEPLYAGSTDI